MSGLHVARAGILLVVLVSCWAGCDRKPGPSPANAVIALEPSRVYGFDGISVEAPPAWVVFPAGPESSTEVLLLEFKAGNKLGGKLYWTTGGMSLDVAQDVLLAQFRSKFREFNVRKREPWLDGGVLIEARLSNNAPSTMILKFGLVFHRGRIYSLIFWAHQGVWYEYSGDVAAVYRSSLLLGPGQEVQVAEPKPEVQAVRSRRHGYQFDLAPGWSFEEEASDASVIVGRLWAVGGIPFGQIMIVRKPDEPRGGLADAFLSGLATDQKVDILKRSATVDGVRMTFSHTIGPVRYRSELVTIGRTSSTLWFQAWAPADDAERFTEVVERMAGSFAAP